MGTVPISAHQRPDTLGFSNTSPIQIFTGEFGHSQQRYCIRLTKTCMSGSIRVEELIYMSDQRFSPSGYRTIAKLLLEEDEGSADTRSMGSSGSQNQWGGMLDTMSGYTPSPKLPLVQRERMRARLRLIADLRGLELDKIAQGQTLDSLCLTRRHFRRLPIISSMFTLPTSTLWLRVLLNYLLKYPSVLLKP